MLALVALLLLTPFPVAAQTLSFVESLRDAPLLGASFVATSSDGRQVYVAGDEAVVVFARDAATGALSFVEALVDGRDGAQGIANASFIALGPEERHVYVASERRGTVAVFDRQESTGRLSFVEAHFLHEISTLIRPDSIALSPDGRHLYLDGYNSVLIFSRDPASGTLSFVASDSAVEFLGQGEGVTVSDDGQHLYFVTRASSIAVFQRDQDSGRLSFVERLNIGLGFPHSMTLMPDGGHLYLAGHGGISFYLRDVASGRLTLAQRFREGVDGVTGIELGRSIAVEPEGRHLYLASSDDSVGESTLVTFARDRENGMLELTGSISMEDEGLADLRGARGVALTPYGRQVLVAGHHSEELLIFARDSISGAVELSETVSHGPGGVVGLAGARSLAIDASHRHVYVVSHRDQEVALFARDPMSGSLHFVESTSLDVEWFYGPTAITLSPTGGAVYVLSSRSIFIFTRDELSGSLELLRVLRDGDHGISGLVAGRSITFSPDGRHLVVTGGGSGYVPFGSIVTFRRDPATENLSFVERDGLVIAASLVFDPDGRHAYATSLIGDLAVYARDTESGGLEILEYHTDGVDGVRGLEEPWSVVMSRDGRHLYVAGRLEASASVALFSRDPASGTLSFVDVDLFETPEETPTAGPYDLSLGPSGNEMYLTSHGHGALFVLARDRAGGALSLTETHSLDDLGLAGPNAVELGPGGGRVYVVGSGNGGTLGALRRNCIADPRELCLQGSRFRVSVEWRDFQGITGSARSVDAGSDTSSLFYFFDESNWEMLVKVLDGCALNDHFWVFAAATTDVEYTLSVTDTTTGEIRSYFNPLGRASPAITDAAAFPTCQIEGSGE